jgi:PAS domain S-box-containing protein
MAVIHGRPEAMLTNSEQGYRSLFEANHLPMWVYDASTTAFLAVNVAAVELYGYSEEEFLTLCLADIGADAQLAEDRAAIVDGRVLGVVGPYVNWTKAGSRIQVIISSRQIEFSGNASRRSWTGPSAWRVSASWPAGSRTTSTMSCA